MSITHSMLRGIGTTFICAVGFLQASEYDDSIESFLHQNFDGRQFGMVVGLVDEHGSKVFAAGKLDNGTDAEVNADTIFEIGSITKTFTVLLLQDMVERGQMKLNDPVAKYLPDSVRIPIRGDKKISLRSLASQDSGLPRNPDNLSPAAPLPANPFTDYTSDRMYAFLSKHTLERDPGVEFGYSNVGMALLGHAITRTAGTDYESLVARRICGPLHMESTCATLTPELKSRLAMGHTGAGKPAPNWEFQVYQGAALRSTANDMLKYVAANLGLTSSKLTPLIDQMHVVQHRGGAMYGNTAMPWYDRGQTDQTRVELWGHAGGTGGYHTFIGFDKAKRRGVVVLSNQQGYVACESMGWLLLEGVRLTPQMTAGLLIGSDAGLVGVGVKLEFDRTNRALRITGVVPNSPASMAQLPVGCLVQKIDDVPTAGKSDLECAGLIHGAAGTKVRMELFEADRKETKTYELSRAKIELPPAQAKN